jgi:hypothetical protein
MKHYLRTLVVSALGSALLFSLQANHTTVVAAESDAIQSAQLAKQENAKSKAVAPVKVVASTPTTPGPVVFNPNDPSTWPTCAAGQIVRGDTGKCADNAPAPTAPTPVASPVYSGSHEDWMAAAGISAGDYTYVSYIVSHESGWCPNKHEGEYGGCPSSPQWLDGHAYGLCQALPGTKMASAGSDWLSNPITQLKWCNSYAQGRYGSWYAAYSYWMVNHVW